MKQVYPFTASEVGMRNAWDINLKVKQFYSFKCHFLDCKTPLTDSQNRILDSKPMSMGEFKHLTNMMFLTRKTHNELYKNYSF